jgi:capsular polysaccharide transport system permease protein
MADVDSLVVFRSPAAITLSVWRALFLRETISRISSSRTAWLWLLLEPVVHALFVLTLFVLIKVQKISGADVIVWLLVGYCSFFTARNIYSRGMEALNANQALFAYRQVLPVDTVLVRAALEALLGIVVMAILMIGVAFFGFDVLPHNPLQSLSAFTGLCLAGLGLGLMLAVGDNLIPAVGKIFAIASSPLYLLSGVIFPLSSIPVQYREIVFLNPFAHGVELVRAGYFPYYHVAPEASLAYLYGFAVVTLFIGLALQLRYVDSLRAQ